MEALIILAVTFVLLWVFFILPQQRRVRAHNELVARLREGEEVILTAGIYGRIVELGAEDMTLEVSPGTELRVARQAVLRRAECDHVEGRSPESDTAGTDAPGAAGEASDDTVDAPSEPT